MSEWKEYKLKDITTKIGSGSTPTGGQDSYKTDGVSLIRSMNIYDFNFDYDGLAKLDDIQAQKLRNVIVEKEDILINITGASVGRCTIVPDDVLPARVNQHVSIIRVNDKISNSKFLLYSINSPFYKNQILGISDTGSTREALTKTDIEKITIKLPPLPTQQKIAHILGTYDELIEVNNERIKLLEETAQSLYKEWFVRFRFPNYQNTEFIKGVPKGWEIGKLESLCNQITDGTHDSPKQKKEGFPLITGKHIKNGFIDFHDAYFISEEDHNKISKRSGLLQGDIIFSNIGTIGNTTIIKYDEEFSVKNVLIFRPLMLEYSSFLYYYLTNESNLEQLLADSFGTSQQFLSLGYCRKLKCLIPTSNIIQMFNDLVNPMIEQKYALQQQNTELRQIRDRLLPRLISGKMEV